MKNLKNTWFLTHPIDLEHKQYVLLDFLKSVNQDIKKDDIYNPVKRIFSLTKEMVSVKNWMNPERDSTKYITDQTQGLIDFFKNSDFTEDEKDEIKKITESSLDVLFQYIELGIELWKNVEKRIKAFDLNKYPSENSYGILILRNMATDELFNYVWYNAESTQNQGIVMKKVASKNNFFSLNYEFIVHEIIQEVNFEKISSPRVTIMEISEDCNPDSMIVKIAKELFVNGFTGKQKQKI